MSGLVKLDKFSPSKRPYAFRWETFSINGWGLASVEAIWPGRKNGRTTASYGHLTGRHATPEEFIEQVDMRYGGYSIGKWDGENLITDQSRAMRYCSSLAEQLDIILRGFPAVPDDYEGWFYRA